MAKWECLICGWIYDESEQGIRFEDQPDDFVCPVCGAPKGQFSKVEE